MLPIGLVDNFFHMIKVSELELLLAIVIIIFIYETVVIIRGPYDLRVLDWVELEAEWLGDLTFVFLS